jgi:hypothetical protein
MAGHECYHCKQWVEEGDAHNCWTTTEAALTADLSEDLKDAYERVRETAVEFGEQRIYASHHSIMYSRKVCYFFVRPKTKYLELWIMLGRAIKAPQVRSVVKGSKAKYANLLRITHRDEVEPPITDWMREAYETHDALLGRNRAASGRNKARDASRRRPAASGNAKSSRTARRGTRGRRRRS